MKKALLLLVIILSMVQGVHAWDSDTHKWISNRAADYCIQMNLTCQWTGDYREYLVAASVVPDVQTKDFINHHCYLQDCPAMRYAQQYFDRSFLILNNSRDRAYFLGVGSHYFSDAQNIWHQVSGEDYETCHKPYEDYIGDYIQSDFSYNITCQLKDGSWIYEYQSKADMEEIARRVALYYEFGVAQQNYADSNLLISQNVSKYQENDYGISIDQVQFPQSPAYLVIFMALLVMYGLYMKFKQA